MNLARAFKNILSAPPLFWGAFLIVSCSIPKNHGKDMIHILNTSENKFSSSSISDATILSSSSSITTLSNAKQSSQNFTSSASTQKKTKKNNFSGPLILKHADQMDASRNSGEYLLSGNVQFLHDSLEIITQKARWFKPMQEVRLFENFKMIHKRMSFSAREGNYIQSSQVASGLGQIKVDAPKDGMWANGEQFNYERTLHSLQIFQRPLFKFLSPDEMKKKSKVKDTLFLSGNYAKYNDSTQFGQSIGNVSAKNSTLNAKSDSGSWWRKEQKLELKGKPEIQVDNFFVRGNFASIQMKQDTVRFIEVFGNAFGQKQSTPKDKSIAEANSDTLKVWFKSGKVDRILLNGQKCTSRFFELGKEKNKDEVEGKTVLLQFEKGQIQEAKIQGQAKSWYHLWKNDQLDGLNHALGDSVNLRFENKKVKKVQIMGKPASGIFYGEAKK
jgi:hypothetical protein